MNNKMKTFLGMGLAVAMLMGGCGKQPEPTTKPQIQEQIRKNQTEGGKVEIRVAAMRGPTGIGLAPLVKAAKDMPQQLNFGLKAVLENGPENVVAQLAKGEIDMAAIPANLAATLYNSTEGKIQVVAINTLGVLELCTMKNDMIDTKALKGKTITLPGKGTTPDFALRWLITQAGLKPDEDVKFEYVASAEEALAALMAGKAEPVLLPQPFATVAQTKMADLRYAFNLNKEWEKYAGEGKTMVTGVLVANKEFLANNKEVASSFMDAYAKGIEMAKATPFQAGPSVEAFGVLPEGLAIKAIPHCNLACITGAEMKGILNDYLTILHGMDAKAVGGNLPADDFYFVP